MIENLNRVSAWKKRVVASCCAVLFLGNPTVNAQSTAYAMGITEPFQDIIVGTSVAGTIAKVLVEEGDVVKEEQLIIELEMSLQEFDLRRRKLIWDSKAELDSAKLEEETLKQDLAATRELFEKTDSVSKDELSRKELEYNKAVAERLRLDIAEEREKIEYDIALDALGLRQIRSPLNGVVVLLTRDVGESCSAQDSLLRIVDASKCYFTSNVDARHGQD
ncbi:biotin/lipoyl-binding protein [Verrucomicrobia bacterium]|nr:biotin/lipoyl-binding protein [Verrucomicrobiota bacterium]